MGRVKDATANQREVAILGPPKVSVSSLLETSILTAFQRFDYRDSNLGPYRARNSIESGNDRLVAGKGTILWKSVMPPGSHTERHGSRSPPDFLIELVQAVQFLPQVGRPRQVPILHGSDRLRGSRCARRCHGHCGTLPGLRQNRVIRRPLRPPKSPLFRKMSDRCEGFCVCLSHCLYRPMIVCGNRRPKLPGSWCRN